MVSNQESESLEAGEGADSSDRDSDAADEEDVESLRHILQPRTLFLLCLHLP